MSETNEQRRASELAQELEEDTSRLTESYQGDGTTNQPIIEYLEENEDIKYILTASMKAIAVNDKGSGETLPKDGEPTYVLTESRILGIMPNQEGDEIYEIPFGSVLDVENHFGWTKWRMEIKTNNNNYHLWISKSDNQKETVNNARDYILEKAEKKGPDSSSDSDDINEERTNLDNSQESQQSPIDTDNIDPEYSFTAKKKGIKIEQDGETTHLTSEKGSKSKFEFTNKQFIASIPQESDDEIFVVDYGSIDNVDFSSSLRKNRIDIRTEDRLYKFWTKDSVDSNELMELIAEGAGAVSFTVNDLLFEDEDIEKEYNLTTNGVDLMNAEEGENTQLIPSNGNEAKLVFTDNRFLSVVPQHLDDKKFSVDYDSIIDIKCETGQITLYAPPETYLFYVGDSIREKKLIRFIYDKIKGNGSNKLAEEIDNDEKIKKITTAKKHGIEIRGNHTKPETFEAKFVFTDSRFLSYIPRKESSKLSILDYDSIVDFESSSGMTKNRIDIHRGSTTYKFWTTDKPSRIIRFLSSNAGRERFELVDSDDEGGTLRIEGWTKGSSDINADVNASSNSKGKSFGVQGGPFFASKTASKSSIKGDISGEITDNTYTAEIEKLKIYKQNLTLKSGVELDIHLSEIGNVFKQQNGLIIEVAGTTFRMGDLPSDAKVSEAVSYIKDHMTSSEEEVEDTSSAEKDENENENKDEYADSANVDTAEKLRELKGLHEDGILTDEEFETKKEELLDDF
jgi:hypothetical protein